MGKEKSTRLSYSSARSLQSCERKYYHYKVANTPIDPDASDSTEAFDIGKAFHKVLEDNLHKFSPSINMDIAAACKEYKVEEHLCMITAMVMKYVELHAASGLKCVICELPLKSPIFVGYVDALMVDESKKEFWVVDLKTAGRWSDSKLAELATDEQLNLYAYFMQQVSDTIPELEGYKFAGCRYRVTTKLSIKQKSGEDDDAFVKRMLDSKTLKSLDIVVPKASMRIEETYARFEQNYKRSMEIRNGAEAACNFGNCMSYFRPCEYWSQCHGATNSESYPKVECLEAEDFEVKRFNEETGSDDLADLL